jgi:carboxypeptidase Taq
MHESQSRLYENHVGYSEEYLRYLLPRLKALFPVEFESITVEKLLEMLNCVTKAPRRLDADEISYHIHILIRYEIERDLVNGKIEVQDLPRIWNAKYKEYLDIDVKNDTE